MLTPVRQQRRLREIATVLSSSGFDWALDALALHACVSLRCRFVCATGVRACPHHVDMDLPLPQRAVAVLERLGPTAIKIGQLLATQTDRLPTAYSEALRTLQDHVTPFPAEQSRQIIAQELRRPVSEVFSEFDDVPLAAASLSQVHRARLLDGTEVAVKVQRPDIQPQVDADLALLGWLARRLERRRGLVLPFRPTAAVEELAEFTRRELDFRNEARTSETIGQSFTDEDGVVIPRVFWELTTPVMLTMELVRGHRPAPREELTAAGLDPDRLLEVGAKAMLRQIFEKGLFHADPHPGNLLLLEGNRVCFLDFGLYGRLDRRERRRMAIVLYALVKGDFDTVSDQLLHLSGRLPGANIRQFRTAVAELVEGWYGQTSPDISVAQLLLRELGLGAHFGIVFPRELLLLARALVHLEATAAVIDPGRSFAELIGPLLPELREAILPGRTEFEQLWAANWPDYLALALELPEVLPHLRDALAGGADVDRAAGPVTPKSSAMVGRALAGLIAGLLGGTLASEFRARRRRPLR